MDQPSPLTSSMLTPMLALIVWTLVMTVWMFALRIPAIQQAKISPADAREPSSLNALPLKVRQVGYNLDNLMQQPTLFYALVAYSYLAGQQNALNIALAWTYVALRVVHSLIQATVNLVLVRFGVFALGTLVLAVLAGRDAWALF
jgi:hypothetical protein